MPQPGRRSLRLGLACLGITLFLAGCGGGGGSSAVPPPGGGGSTPTPAPTATPLPGSSTASIPVTPGAPTSGTFGPVTGGYTGTVSFPAASASSTLSATFLPGTSQPVGTPAIQNLQRRPRNIGAQNIQAIAFVTVTPSVTVTFPKTPDFTFTAPFNVSSLGAFAYVAEYDPTKPSSGWTTIEGPAAASGNTLTFTGAPPPITLAAGQTYGFLLFSVPSAIPTPAPSTTPTPSPTPTPGAGALPNCVPGLPAQSGGSTYTLQSNPSGVAVARVDASSNPPTCAYFSGVTQTTDRPQSGPHAWNYVFASGGASPYVVTVAQQLNGNHTVFYNQAGDSSGALNAASLQSVRRSSSAARGAQEIRRGLRRFSGPGIASGQVLVRFRGGAAQMRARAAQLARAHGVTPGAEITTTGGVYERFVAVPAGTDAAVFAARLRSSSDVADVFPVHVRYALGRAATNVSDLHANNVDQWYLFADGFPNAWSYAGGAQAKIALIDTGIDLNNSDLAANYVGGGSYNACTGNQVNTTPQDTNGHGTNTAGIAAAATNNAVGFAGAGDNVKLLAYDIFPDATASSDGQGACVNDEVAAVNAAVAAGADVISLSVGAPQEAGTDNGFDQGEHDAIEAAVAAGVTVVAAAGNDADGGESGTPHTVLDYPAAYDGVIAVGASALRDNNSGSLAGSAEYVTSYSQYGPGLAVVAPGGDPSGSDTSPLHWIWNYSTSTAAFGSGPGNGDKCRTPSPATSCTAFFAGTSQATPQVAAAAALLVSAKGGHGSLTPAQVAQIIESTADNINDAHQGHGRLNVYKAIATLFNDTGAYSGPTPSKTSPAQVIAFAYANSGANKPAILDLNYPAGVPLDASGSFRIGDVPANAGTYRVGVWYDANGNGIVDAGDQFGAAATACSASQKCSIGTVTMTVVGAGFSLP